MSEKLKTNWKMVISIIGWLIAIVLFLRLGANTYRDYTNIQNKVEQLIKKETKLTMVIGDNEWTVIPFVVGDRCYELFKIRPSNKTICDRGDL